MKNFIKKRKTLIIVILVVVLAISGYFYLNRKTGSGIETVEAKLGNIFQEVSVTGSVKSSENVDLAFETGGKVSKIYTEVGDMVVSGQALIQLDDSEVYAKLAGAKATLKTQEAELNELIRGTREEELIISQTKVDNAKTVLDESKKTLVEKIKNSYTTCDDAIRNKADSFFKTPAIPAPQLNFYVSDSQLKIDIENQRLAMEEALISWNLSLIKITVDSNLASYITEARNNLNKASVFLDKANSALNGLNAGASISQTTIDSWKAGVSAARTNINTAIDSISTAETSYKNAQSALSLAQQELNLEIAGSTVEEINAQEAQVEKARADILNYQVQMDKTILRSPISGTVTAQEAKIGEIVSANVIIVSVMSGNQFEIESKIPEADIAKVKIGDSAKVTLDAYGDDVVFGAKVVKIDPSETIVEGVATYKTTFQFDKNDDRIKSGMTANIDISTDRRENVLVIPQRAVISEGTERFVMVDNGTPNLEKRKIETGLRGIDGNIEVVSGLNEGEKISASGSVK
ncbi:MAG: efflux RND transporter periplasmic adaptor subunit [Candidatus Paceibacterota bacterium]